MAESSTSPEESPAPVEGVGTVPYFVLKLEDGRAKAVFTVPPEIVATLVAYPILCRGAVFHLQADGVSQRLMMQQQQQESTSDPMSNNINTTNSTTSSHSFLSTEYYSPHPEDTAWEIARRLAMRIHHVDSFQVSEMLGI